MRFRRVWGVALVFVAACSSSSSPITTEAVQASESTGTAGPPATTAATTTIAPTTTSPASTTTAIDDEGVGTQAAYDDLVDKVIEEVRFLVRDIDRDAVPLPATRSSVPVVALEEILTFDAWVYETYPIRDWVDLISVEEGPFWSENRRSLDSLTTLRLRFERAGDPGTFLLGVPEAAVDAPSELQGADLEGVVVVRFETRRGPYDLVDWDSGAVEESRAGWHVTGLASLLPTESGWRLYDLLVESV